MVEVYAELILKGLKTLDDVPGNLLECVIKLLNEKKGEQVQNDN